MKNFKKLIKESYLGNPLNEVRTTPVSGTKAGATYSLDSDRKSVLKKDVKGAKIGDYVDITLPKGTVIYNLPGGVFAAHESLKRFATDFNPYYEKPTYSGISVIRSRDTLAAIEDAILGESLNENLMAKFQDALDDDQFDFFQRALDKADRGEELNQSEEQVVKYFGMVKAKYDDAIAQGMSPDEITLNPNKPIDEEEEMTPEEEHEHVKNLLKRNFMDEAEARVDEIDMNDPVLMKARAAQMKRDEMDKEEAKYKAKQAALDKKYGSSFMDKLDAELDLKAELSDLEDEREDVIRNMEEEAEPEGGPIADDYGSILNDMDARIAAIKSELEDLRMYESVNEDRKAIEYIKSIKDPEEREAEMKRMFGGDKVEEEATGGGPVNPINLTIDDEGASDAALDSEVNHMFEEDLAENILKKLFGKKLDPSVVAILVDEINDIIKRRPSIKDKPEEIAKELAKDSDIDPKLLMKPRMGFIGEESEEKVNESKEFNFNKLIKEALTPKLFKVMEPCPCTKCPCGTSCNCDCCEC